METAGKQSGDPLGGKSKDGPGNASRPGQSVFHTKLPAAQQKMAECMLGTSQYLDLLHAVCGAGTHLGYKYYSLLKDSTYAGIAGRFHASLSEVERSIQEQRNAAQGVLDTQWAAALKAVPGKEAGDVPESLNSGAKSQEEQLVAASFLQLLETQCRFFLSTSEALTEFSQLHSLEDLQNSTLNAPRSEPAVGKDSQSALGSTCTVNQSGAVPEYTADHVEGSCKTGSTDIKTAIGQSQSAESPSRLRKQLSSFFSKLGRSNSGSGDIPQSSFYVDIPAEERRKCSDQRVGDRGQGEEGLDELKRKEALAALAGSEAGTSALTGALGGLSLQSVLQAGGQVASQEELDNVIDFLSGGHKVVPSMQSIPENFAPTTQAHVQKAIGSHLSGHGNHHMYPQLSQPMDNLEADYYGNQSRSLHRRSDGLIGETLGSRESKTNTWPYRPGTKSSSLSSDASSQLSSTFGYDAFPNDAEYTRYLAAVKQMKHGSNPYGQQVIPPQSPWATGDATSGAHKGWNMFAGEGTDSSGRNWVGVGDSSSCSDESSNGEAPWMMGIDLVGAMNDKRRHSSGEESFPSGPSSSTTESRPKSVEDLLDAKSTNTWPPKQPWAKTNQREGENLSKENLPFSILHPPLTAQWSDPLASRPQGLSAWSAGIPSALSQQSLPSYGHMSPGGAADQPHTPGAHSKLERKFSVLT